LGRPERPVDAFPEFIEEGRLLKIMLDRSPGGKEWQITSMK
jgi:hypothetical protein